MALDALCPETITPAAFAPYGKVIDWTADLESTDQHFHVLLRSTEPTGWRLAVLKTTTNSTQAIANHPNTWELFAPLRGMAILLVAAPGPLHEETIRAFILDRPACVAPGVWHGNIVLREPATILIAENLEVTSESAQLSRPVGPLRA